MGLLSMRHNPHYMRYKVIKSKRTIRKLKTNYYAAKREAASLKKEKVKLLEQQEKLKEMQAMKEEQKEVIGKEQKVGDKLIKSQEKRVLSGADFKKQIKRTGVVQRKMQLHDLAKGIALHRINPTTVRSRISHLSKEEKQALEQDYKRIMDRHIGIEMGAGIALKGQDIQYLKRVKKQDMAAIRWYAEIEKLAEKAAFKNFSKFNKNEQMLYNRIMSNPTSRKEFEKRHRELMEAF